MDIFAVITLLGGLALFLYGMEVMGDGLKNYSGDTLKKVLEKVTHNVFFGVITGMLVTAVIQSSTATIVLTVGLMSAGILNLKQSVSIVLGANIGTTVTAQIIRLMDINSAGNIVLEFLKPSTLAPIAAILGIIFIMFIKVKRTKSTGHILMGFGILFTGLLSMTSAVAPLAESQAFVDLLSRFSAMPILGIVSGLVLTVIVQSSSAMVGMVQALSVTGAMTFNLIFPIIMGINLGTCVTTAMVCSIGSSKDAKRVGIVHILFNVIGTVLFMVVMSILERVGAFPTLWDKIVNSGDIANFQTFFNLVTAILLLPFTGLLMKLSMLVIRPIKGEHEDFSALRSLDEKLLVAPPVALEQTFTATTCMSKIAQKNLMLSFEQLTNYDAARCEKISGQEEMLDEFADEAGHFLVKLSGCIETEEENAKLNLVLQAVNDFERIGDYAMNIEHFAKQLVDEKLSFSDEAKKEIDIVRRAISEIVELTVQAFSADDPDTAKRIEPLEEVIDELVDMLRSKHLERLKTGECTVDSGFVFLETLTNAERAADQCSSIGLYILGVVDKDIVNNRHAYLRKLHRGSDPGYLSEFEKRRKEYRLEEPSDQATD